MTEQPVSAKTKELPFKHNKIPISHGTEGYKQFLEKFPGFTVCPYIADKDAEGWDKSTSRVYMNQVLPNFIYLPVNISKNDTSALRDILQLASENAQVAAINITQPHKSSPTLRQFFFGDENSDENIDTLIRNTEGKLEPYDLNAPSFVSWFNDEAGSFRDKTVFLVGVGGVGEPMAKAIVKEFPKSLILIDPVDKNDLAEKLSAQTQVTYLENIGQVDVRNIGDSLIVINAAGKEGATDAAGLDQILNSNINENNIFVDIRPQLKIEIVEAAKKQGWQAYTGYGMNSRNDYILLCGIAEYMGVEPIPFTEFQAFVAQAS